MSVTVTVAATTAAIAASNASVAASSAAHTASASAGVMGSSLTTEEGWMIFAVFMALAFFLSMCALYLSRGTK